MPPNAAPAMPHSAATGFDAALEVEAADPLAGPAWDHWVMAHPEAGPFHRTSWARVLVRSYGHRPRYHRIHQRGRTVALLPLMEVDSRFTGRRAVCLPFADACGFLCFKPAGGRLMSDVLSRLGFEYGWSRVELRGTQGFVEPAGAPAAFVTHDLDLGGGESQVWAKFDSSVRRAVRKAERGHVTADIRTDAEAMRSFIRLHAHTRRRHGLPPQPDRFFHAIRDEIIEPGQGAIVLAHDGGVPAAAAVFLLSGQKALFKFGASDDRARDSRANNIAMWHGVRWAIDHGATTLSFGRTAVAQNGLRRFKRGWGAAESPLSYHTLSLPEAQWACPRFRDPGPAAAAFSRLPLAVNRLLGAALYPHLD